MHKIFKLCISQGAGVRIARAPRQCERRAEVFLPYMLTADARPLVERISETELLPKPEEPKVVKLHARL